MKKLILTLFVLFSTLACTTDTPNSDELNGVITSHLKGLPDGTQGVNCDSFTLPPDDIFFKLYATQENTSVLDFRIWELNTRVYFKFYPSNSNFQEFLAVIYLTSSTIYGYDSNGDYAQYRTKDDIFRIRVVGINGTDYDETFCFNPTSYVSAIYPKGKQKLPDGDFEVEFLDYTQFGVGKFYFSKP